MKELTKKEQSSIKGGLFKCPGGCGGSDPSKCTCEETVIILKTIDYEKL